MDRPTYTKAKKLLTYSEKSIPLCLHPALTDRVWNEAIEAAANEFGEETYLTTGEQVYAILRVMKK